METDTAEAEYTLSTIDEVPGNLSPNAGKRGRPSKFTEETKAKVVQALRGGNYRNVAAQYAGISHATLRNWLKNGQDPENYPDYAEFLEQVEKAEADGEVASLALIRRAASDGNWNAASWMLERKSPERWGKRDMTKIELSGPDGGAIDVNTSLGIDTTSIESLALVLQRRAAELHDPLREDILDVEVVDDREVEDFLVSPGELTASAPTLRTNYEREEARPNPALGEEPKRSGIDAQVLGLRRDEAAAARKAARELAAERNIS